MTVIDKTDTSQTDALTFELTLSHAPEKVWRALTDPELLREWLLPAFNLKLERGAAFTLKTQPHPPWDGSVECAFANVCPWNVAGMLKTLVTFTLTPTETGTRLVLVQSGFLPEQKQNWGGARYGWKMMSDKLVDVLGRIA